MLLAMVPEPHQPERTHHTRAHIHHTPFFVPRALLIALTHNSPNTSHITILGANVCGGCGCAPRDGPQPHQPERTHFARPHTHTAPSALPRTRSPHRAHALSLPCPSFARPQINSYSNPLFPYYQEQMFAEAVDVLLAMVPNLANRIALISHGRILSGTLALYSSCFHACTPTPLNVN